MITRGSAGEVRYRRIQRGEMGRRVQAAPETRGCQTVETALFQEDAHGRARDNAGRARTMQHPAFDGSR